jgi:hypothetical protein
MRCSPMADDLPFAGRNVLVIGNGPSTADVDRRRIDLSDPIVRINNFFFETDYHFGSRVDLLQIGGDRWVFPFYGRTVRNIAGRSYHVGAWSCHQPHIAASARKLLPMPERPFAYRDDALRREVEALVQRHGKTPTTGVLALINAHALGAQSITLAGIDLYAAGTRYGEDRSRHAQSLYRHAGSGYNETFHSRDLDLDIIGTLRERGDLTLYRAVENPPILRDLDLAPLRPEAAALGQPKPEQTSDWVSWAGPYPIGFMKVLRRTREIYKSAVGRR